MNALQITQTHTASATAADNSHISQNIRITARFLSFAPSENDENNEQKDQQELRPIGKSCYRLEVDKLRERQRLFEVEQAQAAWAASHK